MPQDSVSSDPASQQIANYVLEHQGTELGTGWFAPMPAEQVDFEEGIAYLREHPNDEFLHKYLLQMTGTFGPNMTRQLIDFSTGEDPHLLALMYETCILNERLFPLAKKFDAGDVMRLAQYTPLIYIKWSLKKNRKEKAYWLNLFSENILEHKRAKPAEVLRHPIPYHKETIETWKNGVVSIRKHVDLSAPKGSPTRSLVGPGPEETSERAMEKLKAIDLKSGKEETNTASFIPYALQMQWHMEVSISTGKHQFRLSGPQTSYGKGLNAQEAKASCLMEVVERVSSFASFNDKGSLHYKYGHPFIYASFEDLKKGAHAVLDPNDMHLEVPYENQPLYWILGEHVAEDGSHPTFVPAQLVFLFCNLDEISLSSGVPSTGLASGNTLAEAKLHALLEVIERDAEKIMPYSPTKCFSLDSDLPSIKDILARAANQGIGIQFLDITSELGIPCYKAFIQGPGGEILKGSGAHLDGKRAAVSALTEVPFHPSWFQPLSIQEGVNAINLGDLPDYSTGESAKNLRLVEGLLVANGYCPIYVNLTRKDLDIPVVKAIVPGLEMFSDFDRFSSFSLRQFAHYCEAFP